MVLLAVPLAIWSASCSCVVFISCCIKIDDWGHFRVSLVLVSCQIAKLQIFSYINLFIFPDI